MLFASYLEKLNSRLLKSLWQVLETTLVFTAQLRLHLKNKG